MNIFDGTAEDLERWFHECDKEHIALCFLLAARAEDRAVFQTLIDEVVELDSILGRAISFILFKTPEIQPPKGKKGPTTLPPAIKLRDRRENRWGGVTTGETVIAGEALRARTKAREHLPRVIDGLYKKNYPAGSGLHKQVVNSSHKIIPDLCEHFSVPTHELPAIVLLVKGMRERFSFPLGERAEYAAIVTFVRQLASVVVKTERAAESAFEMKRLVRELENTFEQLDKRRRDIEFAVEGLRKKHGLPQEPLQAFLLALRAGRDGLSLRAVVAEIPNATSALADQRISKVERLLAQIRDLADGLKQIDAVRGGSLPKTVDDQINRSNEIVSELNKIRRGGARVAAVTKFKDGRIVRVGDAADKLNLWIDLAEKVHKYWPLIVGIVGRV